MSPAAIKAAAKIVSSSLLADFNSYLLVGALCHRDYASDAACRPGDVIYTDGSPGTAGAPPTPVAFPLQLETAEFLIPSITDLIMEPASIAGDLRAAVETLSDKVELGLIHSFAGFHYTFGNLQTGLTPQILDSVDQVLFDNTAANDPVNVVTNEIGLNQYNQRCRHLDDAFTVCVPAPEHQAALATSVAFHRDALCLITRRAATVLPPDAQRFHVEDADLGLTVVLLPQPQGPLLVQIHLLYAVGILRNELGIRLPVTPVVPATARAAVKAAGLPASGSGADPAAALPNDNNNDATTESVLTGLPAALLDPLVDRLHTTLDSLAESIPDDYVRLRAALTLLQKADGIEVRNLLDSCGRQSTVLDYERQRFAEAAVRRHANEIVTREYALAQTTAAIEEQTARLRDLEGHQTRLQTEIGEQTAALAAAQHEFDARVEWLSADIGELESKLTMYLPADNTRSAPTAT